MDSEEKRFRLGLESDYADRVAVTDKSDFADVHTVYKQSLNLFTSQHWIVHVLEGYMCEYLKKGENAPSNPEVTEDPSPHKVVRRTHLLRSLLQYLRTTCPLPNYTSGTLWEELGDCYLQLGSKEIAAESYDSAYWMYVILLGSDHPSAEAVYLKHLACIGSDQD